MALRTSLGRLCNTWRGPVPRRGEFIFAVVIVHVPTPWLRCSFGCGGDSPVDALVIVQLRWYGSGSGQICSRQQSQIRNELPIEPHSANLVPVTPIMLSAFQPWCMSHERNAAML